MLLLITISRAFRTTTPFKLLYKSKSTNNKLKKTNKLNKLTSESCDLAISTRILAAGCTMSRSFMMVAPSLEIVVFPLSSWINLSIPLGPRVVRTTSATAITALMLLTNWAFPWDVSVPSFSNIIWGCCFPQKKKGRVYNQTN